MNIWLDKVIDVTLLLVEQYFKEILSRYGPIKMDFSDFC